jgi:hypothetical protein
MMALGVTPLFARAFCVCCGLTIAAAAAAQTQPPTPTRVYLPNPADEDWSFLRDPTKRTDIWDALKFIPLGSDERFLSLSGEVRYRPEGLRLHGVGERPTISDSYFLQRYLFGASAVLGPHVRIFGELQSGIINGRLSGPRPTDYNSLDMHQAFVELKAPVGTSAMSLKVGRHELSIGSTRLISASPGLNVKRSFDGATLTFRGASWNAAAAVAQLVPIQQGVFDDNPRREQLFWGVAAGRKSPRFDRGELGLYYLGIDRKTSLFAQGVGPETRHTLGMKWNVTATKFDWNYDALLQWGEFADAPIRAWGFATETGFRASNRGWRPRLSLRTDVASGDSDRDNPRLQSFNPLFPGNAYSGAVGLLGPTNLTDFTPALTWFPKPTLMMSFEAPSYWRTSEGDGLYGTDQRLLVPPTAGRGRYVGTNPAFLTVYQITRHLQLQGVITRFLPGRFMEQTFVAKGFGFYSMSAVYRF